MLPYRLHKVSRVSQKKVDYPECEKLGRVHEQIVAITQFFEWLSSKGVILGKTEKVFEDFGAFYPYNERTEKLLYEYFEIDATKLEQERRAMLEKLRKDQTTNLEELRDDQKCQQ